MCTVLIALRCYRDVPLLIAANRDELLSRPSAAPATLAEGITGGRDLLAGGTWLAVSRDGRLCCVTNRRTEASGEVHRDPDRRSRGEIPVLLLLRPERLVVHRMRFLGPGVYNPVNVLHASRRSVHVAHVDDSGPARITELQDGTHVLTVRDVDQPEAAKDVHLQRLVHEAVQRSPDAGAALSAMEDLLRSHDSPSGDALDAACIHGETYGTVSASTVAVHANGEVRYRHAPGRPCVTAFEEVHVA